MSETFKKIINIIKEIVADSQKHNVSTFAASTSFFFFLSLFPTIILICSLIPYTPLEISYVISAIDKFVPEVLRPFIISIITGIYMRSAGTVTVSAVTALWSAGRGMTELINALNFACDYKEKRNYLRLRVTSSVYTLIMLIMLGGSLVLLVFGRRLLKELLKIPGLEHIYVTVAGVLNLQYILGFAIILFIILLLYAKLTAVKTPVKKNIYGGIFSTVLWLVFTYLFSVFLEIYNPFSVYGTLATTVILMFWMYFCIYFLIIGALVNKNLGDLKNKNTRSA